MPRSHPRHSVGRLPRQHPATCWGVPGWRSGSRSEGVSEGGSDQHGAWEGDPGGGKLQGWEPHEAGEEETLDGRAGV